MALKQANSLNVYDTLNFWQTISTDYFRRGGEECDRLDKYLVNGERLMADKLQDTM